MSRVRAELEGLRLLPSLLLRRPHEFYDRLTGYADLCFEQALGRRPEYATVGWQEVLRDLADLHHRAPDMLGEPALREVEESTRRLLGEIGGEDAFSPRWAASSLFARCCYLACRLVRPAVVVETGVAYGVSSAFILQALRVNGHGILHSVDMPPLRREAGRIWGVAVPGELRGNWHIHRGASARVLPALLGEIGALDLFVHDSLHTYRNMRREFRLAWPRLRTGGAVLADDVERNPAFGELRRRRPVLWRVVRDRGTNPLSGRHAPTTFGIAIK